MHTSYRAQLWLTQGIFGPCEGNTLARRPGVLIQYLLMQRLLAQVFGSLGHWVSGWLGRCLGGPNASEELVELVGSSEQTRFPVVSYLALEASRHCDVDATPQQLKNPSCERELPLIRRRPKLVAVAGAVVKELTSVARPAVL